jgi:ketosteroid isomerase-like protein
MTRKIVTPAIAFLPALALLCACGGRDNHLPKSVTTALETAFTRGDVPACVALYMEDAEIIAEDAPVVRGKEAITQFFQDQVGRDIAFDTDSTMSIVQGDLAVDQGTYRIRNVRRGENVEYGEYLNVWRHVNGQWQVTRSMYNVTTSPRSNVSVTADDELGDRVAPTPDTE